MCGIVGYIGKRKAYPILIKGLKRLAYRGYDCAGVALIGDDRQLTGIAYPRRATHGQPCSANARPHDSSSEKLAPLHNDILENYTVLKEKLQAKDRILKNSTDTEVFVRFMEYMKITDWVSLSLAVQTALGKAIGSYAIVIPDKEHPDKYLDDCSIELPETIECLDLLITTAPLQLLACHIAACKGTDADRPGNPAKSVTVE